MKGRKMTKNLIKSTIFLTLMFSPYAVNANTIDNLERERAKALNLILDKSVSIGDRKSKLEKSKMRLLDLERMTINSKNINKNPTYQTIKAFEKFDLTFLVHSSLEKGKSLSLTWLEKIGLTTENLMSTRV
jgi:hypothetical protein